MLRSFIALVALSFLFVSGIAEARSQALDWGRMWAPKKPEGYQCSGYWKKKVLFNQYKKLFQKEYALRVRMEDGEIDIGTYGATLNLSAQGIGQNIQYAPAKLLWSQHVLPYTLDLRNDIEESYQNYNSDRLKDEAHKREMELAYSLITLWADHFLSPGVYCTSQDGAPTKFLKFRQTWYPEGDYAGALSEAIANAKSFDETAFKMVLQKESESLEYGVQLNILVQDPKAKLHSVGSMSVSNDAWASMFDGHLSIHLQGGAQSQNSLYYFSNFTDYSDDGRYNCAVVENSENPPDFWSGELLNCQRTSSNLEHNFL